MHTTSFLLESILGLTTAGALYKIIKDANDRQHKEDNTIVYKIQDSRNNVRLFVPEPNKAGIHWVKLTEEHKLIVVHLLKQDYAFKEISRHNLEIREVIYSKDGMTHEIDFTKAYYKRAFLEEKSKSKKQPKSKTPKNHPDQNIIDLLVKSGVRAKASDVTQKDINNYKKFHQGSFNFDNPLGL